MSWNELLEIRETLGLLSEPILPIPPELKKERYSLLKNNLFLPKRSAQNYFEQSGVKFFKPILSQLKAAVYDTKNNPIDLIIEQSPVNSIPGIELTMLRNILQPDSLNSFLQTVKAFAQAENVLQPDSLSSFLPKIKAFAQEEAIASVNLNIDLSNPDQFYDLPYPSNLRLNEQGAPILSGVPILEGNFLTGSLKSIVGDRFGFPTTATGYFQFNIPVSDQDPNQVIPANVDESILLVELESGRLLPTVASNLLPEEHYVNGFTLAVAPAPGIVLRPGYTYAYVVNRSLNDSSGEALGVSNTISELIQGEVPDSPIGLAAKDLYDPLWETLDQQGLDLNSVAAATVFTTGDVVSQTSLLSEQVLERYDLTIENLSITETHPDFWELHGTIDFPQFQVGTPPFNNPGEGLFAFDSNGLLIEQRIDEDVPIVLTIPKEPMPEQGYPLVIYFHGSNGLSTQVVDRGPILEPGGTRTPGLGPASVVAEQGIAAVGSALPLNPERLPGAPPDAYLNFNNLSSYRDNFVQGVLEQRLLLEALSALALDSSLFNSDRHFFDEQDVIRLQTDSVSVFGQSLGSQFASMIAAVEPAVDLVISTGTSGNFPQLAENELPLPLVALLAGVQQELTPFHPVLGLLLATAWEAAEPIAYMPHIARSPIDDLPANIYMPVGQGDTEVPEAVFNALALASNLEQAGSIVWPELQDSLALQDLDGIVPYPVSHNVFSEALSRKNSPIPYTGTVVQYEGDGITDSHNIAFQLDAVKFQYSFFLRSFLDTGVAVIPDVLAGGAEDDQLIGSNGADNIFGSTGDDSLFGKKGADLMLGGLGNDVLAGGKGADQIFGGGGYDLLKGERGNDILVGGSGNDELRGNKGFDTLTGVDPKQALVNPGVGEIDILRGGRGKDTFVLGNISTVFYDDGDPLTDGRSDYAFIEDFKIGQDMIAVQGEIGDYILNSTGLGTEILRIDTGGDLIAIIDGLTGLTRSDFISASYP